MSRPMALINCPEHNIEYSGQPRHGPLGFSGPLGTFLATDTGFELRPCSLFYLAAICVA